MNFKFFRVLSNQVQSARPLFMLRTLLLARKISSSSNIDKLPHGGGVQIAWHDGETSRYHSSWLRMNCGCDQCKQSYSGQRIINFSQLPEKIKLSDIRLSDDCTEVKVTWDNEENHKSSYKLEWLRKHSYMRKDIQDQSNQRKFHTFKGAIPEHVQYEDVAHSESGLLKFLQAINEDGFAVVKGVPCNENIFRKVVERIGPIQSTIHGELFDVSINPNPDNVAYSGAYLDYHMDIVYYQSPPGLNFLHCWRFDKEVKGGESIFLDVFAIAEQFRLTNPEEFDTLVRVPATFQNINLDSENPIYLKYQRPHIALNHLKEIVSVTWSPCVEGPLFVDEDEVEPYYKAYSAFHKAVRQSDLKVIFKLDVGDLIAFNNLRLIHGREAVEPNGGSRFLKGCFMNIDEFRNKLDVMSHLHGDKRLSKRVGNNCFF